MNSLYPFSGSERVSPLRKNVFPPTSTPLTGIIPPSGALRSPRASIHEVVDREAAYFPGDTIHIRNRFNLPGHFGEPDENYALVSKVIEIYLF